MGPWVLFGAAGFYLACLFLVAELTDRGIIPPRLAQHPITFALSLGVYATSWTYFGSVGLAHDQGYAFLGIYIGVTLSCLVIPIVWLPILRIVRQRQLSSAADLFAFRFQSQALGAVVTLFLWAGSLPYLSLQVRAVTEAADLLAPGVGRKLIALVFCTFIALFTGWFGTRSAGLRKPRPGLVVAIAVESLVKLTALIAVGAVALFSVLGGPEQLDTWLAHHPQVSENLMAPVNEGSWVSFVVLSFAAAFLLPRQFHMAFAQRPGDRAMVLATWLFPLLLLMMNLAILPIAWAGSQIAPNGNPDLYVLQVASQSSWLSGLAFIGGISAASGMMVASSLALAAMAVNQLVLPFWRPKGNLYRRVAWARRVLVGAAIGASFLFYELFDPAERLVDLGLISFVAVGQLLPGLFGILFWSRATRDGVLIGLIAGFKVWLLLLVLPGLGWNEPASTIMAYAAHLDPIWANPWTLASMLSLGLNSGVMTIVSMLSQPRDAELEAAALCTQTVFSGASFANLKSLEQIEQRIERLIGSEAARGEIAHARQELELTDDFLRPAQLRRLAERLEENLTGVVGPLPARTALRGEFETEDETRRALADQVRFLEEKLQTTALTGPAAQIDTVRRYLRGVLEELPLAVCVLGPDADVVLWNDGMRQITGLEAEEWMGVSATHLPSPWGRLLTEALLAEAPSNHEVEITIDDRPRILRLESSRLEEMQDPAGLVLMIEDLTDQRSLESKVAHQDRLASIGRLSAGVAHEIGNPLTGILMVASNLRRETPEGDVNERVGLIETEAKRIQDIVSGLLTFGRSEPRPQGSTVEVRAVVNEALALLHLSKRHRQIPVDVDIPENLLAIGHHQQLIQVVLNLVANACDASSAGKAVQIRGVQNHDTVCLDIEDHGAGMSDDIQKHIFEPFFTTKDPGEGTGLGLAVVYRIVQEHQGKLDVTSVSGKGTTMTLTLPSLPASPKASS